MLYVFNTDDKTHTYFAFALIQIHTAASNGHQQVKHAIIFLHCNRPASKCFITKIWHRAVQLGSLIFKPVVIILQNKVGDGINDRDNPDKSDMLYERKQLYALPGIGDCAEWKRKKNSGM